MTISIHDIDGSEENEHAIVANRFMTTADHVAALCGIRIDFITADFLCLVMIPYLLTSVTVEDVTATIAQDLHHILAYHEARTRQVTPLIIALPIQRIGHW